MPRKNQNGFILPLENYVWVDTRLKKKQEYQQCVNFQT